MSANKSRMLQSLVTVRLINPTEARPADLAAAQNLADSILQVGACIRPLIVRPAGFDVEKCEMRYEVVGDHLAYWAAALARDASPVAFESVNCWIIEGDAAAALAQLAA